MNKVLLVLISVVVLVLLGCLAIGAIFGLSLFKMVESTQPVGTSEVVPAQPAEVEPAPKVSEVPDEVGEEPVAKATEEEPPILRFHGVVLDAESNEPVAGASLFITNLGARNQETLSDEEGGYTLDIPVADWLRLGNRYRMLYCEAPDFARQVKSWAGMPLPDPESLDPGTVLAERADFVLQAGATIMGRVVDGDTGAGIAGVSVSALDGSVSILARAQQNNVNTVVTTTDETGGYVLQSLLPGSYTLVTQAAHLGYVPVTTTPLSLGVGVSETKHAPDIKMTPGGVVKGTVHNSANEPVDNALLIVMPGDTIEFVTTSLGSLTNIQNPNGRSDEEGNFEIKGIPLNISFKVTARKENFAEASSSVIKFTRDVLEYEVELVLSKGSTISGIAKYDDGKPAAIEPLILMPDVSDILSGNITGENRATTDQEGRFSIDLLSAGKYTLSAGTEIDPLAFSPFGDKEGILAVEVDGQNNVENLELTIARAKANSSGTQMLRGSVVDANGKAAPNVRVQATAIEDTQDRPSAITLSDGSFVIAGLKNSLYNLKVESELGNASLDNVATTTEPVIRLSAPTPINGYVVKQDGSPVAGATVTLVSPVAITADLDVERLAQQILGEDPETRRKTDDYGYFEFDNVSPGEYTLKARSKSYGSADLDVTITAGSPKTGLRLVVESGVLFTGRVVDSEGRVLSGANVHLSERVEAEGGLDISIVLPQLASKVDYAVATDVRGTFSIENVAPGTYSVKAEYADLPPAIQRDVLVDRGQNVTNFEIVMSAGGSVEGTIIQDGEPSAGMMVQLVGDNGTQMGRTDSDGYFLIEKVPPGAYKAQAVNLTSITSGDFSGILGPIDVEVLSGEAVVVDFSPPEGDPAISGIVVGDLPQIGIVSLRRPGGPAPGTYAPTDLATAMEANKYQVGQAILKPDGSFSIPTVAPGEYILEFISYGDISNMADILGLDLTPLITQTIEVVEGEPIELELVIP